MPRTIPDQQKISLLIAMILLFLLVTMIGFGSAVAYNMARLQEDIHEAYLRPFAVSNAGLNIHAALSRLHNHMLKVIISNDPATIPELAREMPTLDANLHRQLAIISRKLPDDPAKIADLERQLDEWKRIRTQMIDLVQQGHKDQALKLAMTVSVPFYSRMETEISALVATAQVHVEKLLAEAQTRADIIVKRLWWFLGALILSGVLFGFLVIRKVGAILARHKRMMSLLFESEERMKLALSGADEGTWDLDITTGKLNFDAQWGEILGFESENTRPHNINEWAALIHSDDRPRVLKAMQDHVDGWTSEYKAEYRIRSQPGALKWVLGHGRAVHRDAEGRAQRIVGITRDITLKKLAEDKIWQLAHSDSLTGLPNRALFYDRLSQSIAQAARHNRKFALLFLDLDGFKNINDQFGHDTGDDLLHEVAERLRQNVREEDTVARLGGDEFIFILNNVSDAGNAALTAQKIIRSLSIPFVIRQNICRIGCSIGISIFPDDSDNMETLVTQSDDAMYRAKQKGRNNYQFHSAR